MKTLILVFGLLSMNTTYADSSIYGWDILCKGKSGLELRTHQSDDDLVIEYKGDKLGLGENWASSSNDYDSSHKILLFKSEVGETKTPDIAMTIVRKNVKGEGYGTGVALVDSERYELNCYARYGVGEEDFDTIVNLPFPTVKAPNK